ncbi:MAG TPA: hypothetical protein VFL96_14490, partial [Acidobacteriaceae bacterium]|nr:hypothetical protein [Acidobacteriaceae bacterium]
PQSAPAAPPAPNTGIGGLFQGLANILNPQAAGRNATINYLTKQGYDPGTAMLIAGDKPLLRQVLIGGAAQNSPKSQLELEKLGLEVNNLKNPTTSDITEFNFDKKNGYTGSFHDWMLEKSKSGALNVNLPGQPNIGSIPAGYQAIQDPTTKAWTMQPIPGGPADTAQTDAAKAGGQATKSDVITNAYKKASELAGDTTTGLVGQGLGMIPPTNAAELRRQVDVLKANATVESLNAMRAQSKTGGALGNVTEKEGAMLAATAGALNPNASPEQFKAALDNYYHTLLRIVNGPEAGDKMFSEATKAAPTADIANMPAPEGIDPKVWKFVPPEKRKLWMQ